MAFENMLHQLLQKIKYSTLNKQVNPLKEAHIVLHSAIIIYPE